MNLRRLLFGLPKEGGRRGLGIAVRVTLLAGIAIGLAMLVFELVSERPNLYDPTRIALVEAQRNLSEAYGHNTQERAMLEEVRQSHHAVGEALSLLEQAERLDSADKATIDGLRARLTLLEDDQKMLHMTDDELRLVYQEMSEQIQKLIESRE